MKRDKSGLVEDGGFQQSTLEYPEATEEEIFEAPERFYRTYYLRPKPIPHFIKTMLEDKEVFVRRCREGYEFFKSLKQRKDDLAAAKRLPALVLPQRAKNSSVTAPRSIV